MANPIVTYVVVPNADTPTLVFSGTGKVRLYGGVIYFGTDDLAVSLGSVDLNGSNRVEPIPSNDLARGVGGLLEFEFSAPAKIFAVCQRQIAQHQQPAGPPTYTVESLTNQVAKIERWY